MAMGEQIAALVLPRLSASVAGRRSPVRGAPLPVADLLGLPRTGSLRYGMARGDADGRVSNRATIAVLGWCCGDRLHITLLAGSVVVHRHPSGVFTMPTKPDVVVLPAPVRKRSGMRAGEQVLIAADPNHDVMVVHPLSALDSMITAYHASLVDGGDGDDHPAQ
jgi:hypothetical protein